MRVKITLAYDGTLFQGFQVQSKTNNTIAHELYKALKSLNIEGTIVASGRTDKGVHATGQVVHVDLPDFWTSTTRLHDRLHQKLPTTIQVRSITTVSDTFHARYSAKKRRYRYILSTKPTTPFTTAYVTHVAMLDLNTIKEAIACFEGTHDLVYFHKQGSKNKTTQRTIFKTRAYRYKDHIVLTFDANSFLRSQIRLMVGAILNVNENIFSLEDLKAHIDAQKEPIMRLAPPNGLYLSQVFY